VINQIKTLIIFLIVIGLLTGCGGSQGDTTTSSTTQPLTVYKFTATVSHVGSNFFLPIAVGDSISGSFSYLPDGNGINITSNSAAYQQKAPASVQVLLGSVSLNGDLNFNNDGPGGYNIEVDNDSVAGQPQDAIYIFSRDTQIAKTYGLASIGMTFSFVDITKTALDSTALLSDIDISKFDHCTLGVYGNSGIQSLTTAQITSLTRVQ
jgi:hypothetical protein